MRNKKSRKSLFTWCIRTLAVSLVPSLLLVSCASDSGSGSSKDTSAPTVNITSPTDNTVTANSSVTVSLVSDGTGTSITATSVTATSDNGTVVNATENADGTWTLSGLLDGTQTISASVTDEGGNSASAQNAIVVDTTAPTITGTNPAAGGSVVGTQTYTITFSEEVTGLSNASAGACSGNVQLTADGTNCLALTVSQNGNEWVIDAAEELSNGSYTLTIANTGIQDGIGNSLAGDTSVTFTVADALTTVLNELETDLTAAGISETLIGNIRAAARDAGNGVTNDLYTVLPTTLSASLAVVYNAQMDPLVRRASYDAIFASLMGNVNEDGKALRSAHSLARIAAVDDEQLFLDLLTKLTEVLLTFVQPSSDPADTSAAIIKSGIRLLVNGKYTPAEPSKESKPNQ